jgi:hypothetical protein
LDLLNWFSNVTDDPERRKFIFSKQSFDKLEAVGPKAWLTWIRDEIQGFEAAAMASLEKEMARGFTEGGRRAGIQMGTEDSLIFSIAFHSPEAPQPMEQQNNVD